VLWHATALHACGLKPEAGVLRLDCHDEEVKIGLQHFHRCRRLAVWRSNGVWLQKRGCPDCACILHVKQKLVGPELVLARGWTVIQRHRTATFSWPCLLRCRLSFDARFSSARPTPSAWLPLFLTHHTRCTRKRQVRSTTLLLPTNKAAFTQQLRNLPHTTLLITSHLSHLL
jgi:hypothetical protein